MNWGFLPQSRQGKLVVGRYSRRNSRYDGNFTQHVLDKVNFCEVRRFINSVLQLHTKNNLPLLHAYFLAKDNMKKFYLIIT